MIYDVLRVDAAPFSYSLAFEDRITLVRGNGATGRTFLYRMLEGLRFAEEYRAMRLFDYKTDDFHENLRKCRDRFIVIDNADLILDDEDRRFINFETSNQYMLFARNCDGLNLSSRSLMLLHEEGFNISLEREMMTA